MIAAVVVLGLLAGLLVIFVAVILHEVRRTLEDMRRAGIQQAEVAEARALHQVKEASEERLRLIGQLREQEEAHRAAMADLQRAEAADRARLIERIQTPPSWPMLPELPGVAAAPADHEVDRQYVASGAARLPWDADLAPLPGDPDHEETAP